MAFPLNEKEPITQPSENVRPLSWAGHTPDSRPERISLQSSIIGQTNLQPRDAKIPKDSGLLDLASFLREYPSPPSTRSATARVESKGSEIQSPSQSRFINRVLRVSTRRFGLATTGHQRQKSSATRTASTPGTATSKGSAGASSAPPTWFQQKEIAVASPFDEDRMTPNPIQGSDNHVGNEVHGMFALWLEREIEKQRREHSPVLPRGVEFQNQNELSGGHFRAPQASKLAAKNSHTLQHQDRRHVASHSPGTVSSYRSVPSAKISQHGSNVGLPTTRSALSSHPTDPISLPPQRSLPSSPTASTSVHRHIVGNVRPSQRSTAQRIYENYHAGSMKHRTGEDLANKGIRLSSVSPNTTNEESLTIPAKHNVGVHLPANALNKDSCDAEEISVHHTSSSEAKQLGIKNHEKGAAQIEPTTSPNHGEVTRRPGRKIREDRTRASKLKHLKCDSQSSGEVKSPFTESLTSPTSEKSKSSLPGRSGIGSNATHEKILIVSQDTAKRQGAESSTNASPASCLAVGEQGSAASQKPNSAPFVTITKPKSSNIDRTATASATLTKSISAPSLSVETPMTLLAALDKDTEDSAPEHVTTTKAGAAAQSSSPILLPAIAFKPNRTQRLPHSPTQHHVRHPGSTPTRSQTSPQRQPIKKGPLPLTPTSTSPQAEQNSKPRPNAHKQQLQNRISYLERENRLLEAALMAVLKTGGALNRCPCPCYCDGQGNQAEVGAIVGASVSSDVRTSVNEEGGVGSDTGVSKANTSTSAVHVNAGERAAAAATQAKPGERSSTASQSTARSELGQLQLQPDSGIVMTMASLNKAKPESVSSVIKGRDKAGGESRWSYATSTSASADSERVSFGESRSSGSSALALYMQTRRASGFGFATSHGGGAHARVGSEVDAGTMER